MNRADYFFALVSAGLFYFSFPNLFNIYGYPILVWVFAVPLFYALEGKGLGERLFLGGVFGLAAYALILSWVINVNVFLFVFFTALFAVQPVIFCAGFFLPGSGAGGGSGNKTAGLARVFFCAAWWTCSEALRTGLTGGFAWTAGHSQAFIPEVIQIADMTGAYGVSFVILLVNGCVYFMMRQRRLFAVYSAVGAVVIAVVLGYGYVTIRQGSGGEICLVCVVQPDILSREKADPARIDELTDRHLALTRQCFEGARLPDLVVWPETAVAEDVARDRIVNHKIRAFIREHSVRMLVGSAMMIEGKNYNSAVLFQENGQIEGIYHKQHLLPFHEFFPFENLTAGLQNRLRLKNYDFHRGREAGALPLEQGRADKSFGAAICSEEGYPGVFRRAASDGAGLMIAMLNDAWFESQAAMMLHAQTGLMHAAAFKLPLVRGSNNGLSCAADRYGRLRRSGRDSRLEQEAVFVFDVEPRPSMTAYARHGDIFVLVCAVVSMMILWNTRQEQGDAQNGD